MRVVLAYAGDLEGSAAIQWLRDAHRAGVVTVTVDLGQGAELAAIRDRALTLGARRAHVIDGRERFAEHFGMPAGGGRRPVASFLFRSHTRLCESR